VEHGGHLAAPAIYFVAPSNGKWHIVSWSWKMFAFYNSWNLSPTYNWYGCIVEGCVVKAIAEVIRAGQTGMEKIMSTESPNVRLAKVPLAAAVDNRMSQPGNLAS